MRKIFFLLFTIFNCYRCTFAQQWKPLARGFNWPVREIFADTVDNIIYAGGDFTRTAKTDGNCDTDTNGMWVWNIAQWDGTQWDSLECGMSDFMPCPRITTVPCGTVGGFTSSITRYKGEIYVGGPFEFAGNVRCNGLAKWDGSKWDSVPRPIHQGVQSLLVYEDTLFVTGWAGQTGGLYESRIYKFDGNNWYTYPILESDISSGFISTVAIYKGELYVGGNFVASAGPGMYDIARFDYNTHKWKSVGGGTTCDCWVNKLYVWHDTLIVAGYFQQLGGTSFNNIAAWDGNNWSDLGGGTQPANVDDVIDYDGYLYVCGQINFAGGIPVSRMAKWDGRQWYDPGHQFSQIGTPGCFTVFNNELYVGGGFSTINGDTMNNIAKYSPTPVSVKKELNHEKFDFEIYPNPAMGIASIEISDSRFTNVDLIIYDLLGQIVHSQTVNSKRETLKLNLTSGIYFYKVMNRKEDIGRGKLVIQKQ